MKNIFPWKRFWCSRNGSMSLADNGFLVDPESEHSKYYQEGVVSFEKIQDKHCLLLLGKPGSGKTTSLDTEKEILSDKIKDSSDMHIYKNLNEYADENRLINEIFKSSEMSNWLNSKHHLYLFLDSLDECLLGIPKIAIILRNQFKEIQKHKNRLSLRITCRTGDYPESLTNTFNAIWDEKNVGVYELTPLRRKDICEAAKISKLDPDCFIEDIIKNGLQSLAGNPITLNFLLKEFKNKNKFSDSKASLYLRGCEYLCTENNQDRVESGHGGLSPARRLTLASRIAAVMMFCSYSSILTKSNLPNTDEKHLTLSILREGEETTGDDNFNFTENDLREAITQTALFSGRGPNLFGFAHQSYAEFLAARYLLLHKLSIQQIKTLIQISNDPDQMIIPQMKQISAWLYSMDPEVIQEIIKTDPQSLLSGDIGNRFRENLVDSLLKQFEQVNIVDSDMELRSQYYKLKHPELATQLKLFIQDKTKYFLVRRVAIDIAEACELKELQELLMDITFDKSDKYHIRDQAVHAVSKIADENVLLRLKPLALEEQKDDEEDQLKGVALCALWPKYLSAKEIFESLTPQKRTNFYGSYAVFLNEFPDQLKIEDLSIALQWVKENPNRRLDAFSEVKKLSEKILFRAWQNLDNNKILEGYAEAIIPRLKNYLSICPVPEVSSQKISVPVLSDEIRKKLVVIVVRKIEKYRKYLLTSISNSPQILFNDDLKWIIEEFKTEKNEKIKKNWIEIIEEIFSRDLADHMELMYKAMLECPQIEERFRDCFTAVLIDSEQADKMREEYKIIKECEKKDEERKANLNKKITFSVHERIKTCLNKFENGDSNFWYQLCLEMTREDTSEYYGNEHNTNLLSLPGWKICDTNLQKRIIEASKKYILKNNDNTNSWLGKNIFCRPAIAGYKAFILLKQVDPNFIENLNTDIWEKWAAIILKEGNDDEEKISIELINQAYQYAPEKIITTLIKLIDKENSDGNIYITRKIEHYLDIKLQTVIYNKIIENSLKPGSLQELLEILIKVDYKDAIKYAKSLLINRNIESKEKAKVAALSLMRAANDAGWKEVWDIVQMDSNFGKELFSEFEKRSDSSNSKSFPDRIGEKNTADLFIWMNKNPFQEEDSREKESDWVSPRKYSRNLLEFLKERGTIESINALECIKKQIPEMDIIDFYLITAHENFRRKKWIPLKPEEFLLFVKNSSYKRILNEDDLLNVLLELLKRLEEKLHGETPQTPALWSRLENNKWRPMGEDWLSDYVKVFLNEGLIKKGFISLREVQIRRKQGEGGISGEDTDIYVTGVVPSTNKNIKVIIEVKGCWHEEVNTAMKTQLLDRYLKENDSNFGIYLVGWYCCNQWDKEDSKKNNIKDKTIEEVRAIFEEQAKKLSSGNKTIKAFVLNCALR